MKIAVITPIFDDWSAFGCVMQEISSSLADCSLLLEVAGVDDGSPQRFDPLSLAPAAGVVRSVEILHLGVNLGHQRAIAIGLVDVARREDLDGVVVMDCDGEDRPADLPKLLAMSRDHPGEIIVAQRAERSESRSFKIGYAIYKLLFRLLTGDRIYFGNFCFIPMECVRRLVFMSEIWNNLPAAILRSRIGHVPVATARGSRYSGRSQMNWVALIAHGLSAMSVYIDVVFVRILSGAAIFATMALLGGAAAVATRFATSLTIPGWTTTVVGVLGLLLMQTAAPVVAMLLLVLAGRNGRPIVPLTDARVFVVARERYELKSSSPTTSEWGMG